jgi:DNA polymerase I-like protein with 3'-5' exonuclease and polymerase domains/5'-3' exonuclease
MKPQRLIIDGNSLLNAAILRGKDSDEGKLVIVDGKPVQVNSAQYGVDNFFDKVVADLKHFNMAPRQIICVWDGRNSKVRRRTFLERYKEGRDKIPEVNEQLNLARERITKMLGDLGAHVAWQDGLEADDVIGYLCKHLRNNIVRTEDGDLCVLVNDERNNHVFRLGEMDKNPYGPFPHKFITLYKALVGDSGDKIPGAKGFGDGKFVDLVAKFGFDGLQAFEDLILSDQLGRLREDLDALPSLKHVLEDQDGVKVSWRVASLMVDDVNTRDRPLNLQPGLAKAWDSLAPQGRVDDLKDFYATKTLVHAGNYEAVKRRFGSAVRESEFVAMDIETSTPDESDEWLERVASASEKGTAKEKVDVLGSELTGMGLTFGFNMQHTIYMTVDHREEDEVKNITVDQCRELCELIPHKNIHTVIQNRAFEFPVLYKTWGDTWKNNGWHGFWPNAIDSLQGASYTNENLPLGLKERSLHHFGYQQQTYDEVTTIDGRQYKMRELPARHVLNYGADDPMCTAALHTHYRLVMEIEGTWDLYLKVEQKPEYLTSLAFTRGFPVSQEKLRDMELKDNERFEKARAVIRKTLFKHSWDGTVKPELAACDGAAARAALALAVEGGDEFTTRSRKAESVAKDIREQFPDNVVAGKIADALLAGDLSYLQKLVDENFTGDPIINFDSPKQMSRLFYRVIGIRPRILNKPTDNEKAKIPALNDAWKKWRKKKDGKDVTFTDAEWEALLGKASAEDTAVDLALKLDELTDDQREFLTAFKTVKSVGTRRKMFYKQYKVLPHWKTGRVHPSLNQSRAVTRRYSASGPNVQQLPKRGEGVEFRKIVLPHKKSAVVASLDFKGQELILMADRSRDEALMSCFVGDNKRDVHSLTAVQAAPLMWNQEVTYPEFEAMRRLPKDDPQYTKAKTLREDSKTVNFATQYDAQAETVSHSLICEPELAQKFMDAKEKAFPGISPWKDQVRATVEELGYATTVGGARRHLAYAFQSGDKWEAMRAGRQGPNFVIQGSAGEQTKLAMSNAWDSGVFTNPAYDVWFYFPVHDEFVFSVVDEHAVDVIKSVHASMVAPYFDMCIPPVSSISLGKSYGDQIECGDDFDEAAIRAAVQEALQ